MQACSGDSNISDIEITKLNTSFFQILQIEVSAYTSTSTVVPAIFHKRIILPRIHYQYFISEQLFFRNIVLSCVQTLDTFEGTINKKNLELMLKITMMLYDIFNVNSAMHVV